jgi:hypothetical protein
VNVLNSDCLKFLQLNSYMGIKRSSLLVFLMLWIPLFPLYASVEVQNPTHAGFTVTADEENVQIKSPLGITTTISDETYPGGAHPGLIVCSWDPSGTWVAVFIPDKQATEIHVYELKKGKQLQQKATPLSAYPDWYENAHAAYDEPTTWKGGTLGILTRVTLGPTGQVRELPQSLTIAGNSFLVKP